MMYSPTIDNILKEINNLPEENKDYLREVILKQLTEQKGEKLLLRIREAESNYSSGETNKGTAEDLLRDIDDN